jgi:hypothetical protein
VSRPVIRLTFTLAAVMILMSGEVHAVDSKGKFVLYNIASDKCSTFLIAFGKSSFKNKNGSMSYNRSFAKYLGFIGGYMTAVNAHVPLVRDHYKNQTVVVALGWVSSWCRDNSQSFFGEALQAYSTKHIIKLDIIEVK